MKKFNVFVTYFLCTFIILNILVPIVEAREIKTSKSAESPNLGTTLNSEPEAPVPTCGNVGPAIIEGLGYLWNFTIDFVLPIVEGAAGALTFAEQSAGGWGDMIPQNCAEAMAGSLEDYEITSQIEAILLAEAAAAQQQSQQICGEDDTCTSVCGSLSEIGCGNWSQSDLDELFDGLEISQGLLTQMIECLFGNTYNDFDYGCQDYLVEEYGNLSC